MCAALHEDTAGVCHVTMALATSTTSASHSNFSDHPRAGGRDKRPRQGQSSKRITAQQSATRYPSDDASSEDELGGGWSHAPVASPVTTFATRTASNSVFSPVEFKPNAKMQDLLASDFDDILDGGARGEGLAGGFPPPVSQDLNALALRTRTVDPNAPMAASRRRNADRTVSGNADVGVVAWSRRVLPLPQCVCAARLFYREWAAFCVWYVH